jgi:hypothetical protein
MPSSIRRALNELPTTLYDTYERALEGIPKEKRQYAHRLFLCLIGALRPLRAEELAELFAIDFDQDSMSNFMEGWRPENPEEAVLSTCSTLISIIDDKGTKIVQFSHFSVKEFLISDRLRTSDIANIRDYHIPLNAAHVTLARACLAVLLQLDENMDKKRLETFPLALYAAEHWVEHARYEDVASRVQTAMEELFNPTKPHLAAWVWIHDVDDHGVHDLTQPPSPPRELRCTMQRCVVSVGWPTISLLLTPRILMLRVVVLELRCIRHRHLDTTKWCIRYFNTMST